MSLPTFILKSESGRHVLGAYLVFNAILTSYLTYWTQQHLDFGNNLIEYLAVSLFVSSLFTTLLVYIQPEILINLTRIGYERWKNDLPSFPSLNEVSKFPYVEKSKDIFLGTCILCIDFLFLAALLIIGVDFPKTLIGKEWTSASVPIVCAFFVGVVCWIRGHQYLYQLKICWRFYILRLSMSKYDQNQSNLGEVEKYLSIGAWKFAQDLLDEIGKEIKKELEETEGDILKAEKVYNWSQKPDTDKPDFGMLFNRGLNLKKFGFQYIELNPSNQLIPILEEIGKPLLEFRDKISDYVTDLSKEENRYQTEFRR
jgi:hypothetical protein